MLLEGQQKRRKVSLSSSGTASRSIGSPGGAAEIRDIVKDAMHDLVQLPRKFLGNVVGSDSPDELVNAVEAMETDMSDVLEQLTIAFTAAAAARELPADSELNEAGPAGDAVLTVEELPDAGAVSQYYEEVAACRTAGEE
jgi:hypothetical protein